MRSRKKLIEVALPLEAINKAAAKEKSIRHGHPATLHLWWARRPLAAARAVIFAQMVDDPSETPDLFPTAKAQEKERQRLFKIIEELVLWENVTNQQVLQRARDEIAQSWRRACADNADHPLAKQLFNRQKLPAFHDPFAGGGSIPLEAQRLGLEAFASDLNPVAVLINKVLIEFPPKFTGRSPVNAKARGEKTLIARQWPGSSGLAEDVRHYAQWIQDQVRLAVGELYPKVEITNEMVKERPDLRPLLGEKLQVVAWLWARTVPSPDPAFAGVAVPLASTFVVSSKQKADAFADPVISGKSYRFVVRTGKPKNKRLTEGTKVGRGGNFECLLSGTPIPVEYIRAQGLAGNLGSRMMAVVAVHGSSRVYLSPDAAQEASAAAAKPFWAPDQDINYNPRDIRTQLYGLTKYGQLFTPRQLVTLTEFSDGVQKARAIVHQDALKAGLPDEGENGASAYADAVAACLGLATDRLADRNSTLCGWDLAQAARGREATVRNVFARQALPMVWDYAEVNVLGDAAGGFDSAVAAVTRVVERLESAIPAHALQADATEVDLNGRVVSTDPPYFDNIGYADLSDFFYVWLRRSLKPIFPDIFSTLTVPKANELVATPYRHGSKEKAESFFLDGMTKALMRLREHAHPGFPVTIYYAFKQSETEGVKGTASTGWETFLDAIIRAGFGVSGTWPMRTELGNRLVGNDTNALASSIVLVCLPRPASAPVVTRRDFIAALKSELPRALGHLQRSNIAPVDLAQAAIGPGMSAFTRYERVLDSEGRPVAVREALQLINQILDEVLAAQEGDFDSDSRWALAWFEQYGFTEGEFGSAETLSKAKNTSVGGLVDAGILSSKRGKVRLLKPEDLPSEWDPREDKRLTVWEMVHHLIRVLEDGGEGAAAELAAKLGPRAEVARELGYRLYAICERKKRSAEAVQYNALVQSWREIQRLVSEANTPKAEQTSMFEE